MSDQLKESPFHNEFPLSPADEDLIRVYRRVNRSVDDLAYTDDFEQLYKLYGEAGHQ